MQFELIQKENSSLVNQSLLDETNSHSSHPSANTSIPRFKKQKYLRSPLKNSKNRNKKMDTVSIVTDNLSQIRPEQPEQFQITQQVNNEFVFNQYDIWDLTYSLIIAKIDKGLLFILFVTQVFVRYFSIISLIYITIQSYSEQWFWIFILIFSNTLYFICIVKISLKPAQKQSEFILKQSFNSLQQNEALDYFQVISPSKFMTSVLRGMVPPEFSFCYIKDTQRKAEIYAMINYMYSSIESVIYYPFFIIYMMVIIRKQKQFQSQIMFYVSLGLICFVQLLFIIFSIYLIIFGMKKKGIIKGSKER